MGVFRDAVFLSAWFLLNIETQRLVDPNAFVDSLSFAKAVQC